MAKSNGRSRTRWQDRKREILGKNIAIHALPSLCHAIAQVLTKNG
jgi:hypothetical protein